MAEVAEVFQQTLNILLLNRIPIKGERVSINSRQAGRDLLSQLIYRGFIIELVYNELLIGST